MNSKEFHKRYKLDGKVPKGGMSEVAIYLDQVLERKVVIKSLQPHTDQTRLLDEIKALQSIRSKHVVEIYDIIRNNKDEVESLIEEFLPGKDLNKYEEKSSEKYLQILYQVSTGISDIHSKGIIHRDIKPNNMKFDAENFIKIFDFGLARESDINNNTIGFKGTKPFAAPELYTNKKIKFTEAIDTYAFGITAFLLTGNTLPNELVKSPPVPVAKLFNTKIINISEEIIDILNNTISLDPSQRPLMKEIASLIGNHLLYNKHRATIVSGSEVILINKDNNNIDLSVTNLGNIKIIYDGIYFKVSKVKGEIIINNSEINNGFILPGSCVIAFGAPYRGANRVYATFDISHPEVIL